MLVKDLEAKFNQSFRRSPSVLTTITPPPPPPTTTVIEHPEIVSHLNHEDSLATFYIEEDSESELESESDTDYDHCSDQDTDTDTDASDVHSEDMTTSSSSMSLSSSSPATTSVASDTGHMSNNMSSHHIRVTRNEPLYSTLTRSFSTTSTATTNTTSTLPEYAAAIAESDPPPSYRYLRNQQRQERALRSPPSVPSLTTYSLSSPAMIIGSGPISIPTPISISKKDKYNTRKQRERRQMIQREIPPDHPVHDLTVEERLRLSRMGLDPVIAAEMRVREGGRRRARS